MVVCIIGGKPGVGKTSQLASVAKLCGPTRWASLELKDRPFLEAKGLQWDQICKIHPPTHIDLFGENDAYMEDPHATLDAFQDWVIAIIMEDPPAKLHTIVVDGISDLREYAIKEWIFLENEARLVDGRKIRKTIGQENLSAWSEVNERIKHLLKPIINYSMSNGVNLFMTAQMGDKYESGVRIGEKIDTPRWLDYYIEIMAEMVKESNSHFFVDCMKVPPWAECGPFVSDLEKDLGLLTAFASRGLIQCGGEK